MASFLANERKINKYYGERHNGPNNACPNCVSLKDKKYSVLEFIFSGTSVEE